MSRVEGVAAVDGLRPGAGASVSILTAFPVPARRTQLVNFPHGAFMLEECRRGMAATISGPLPRVPLGSQSSPAASKRSLLTSAWEVRRTGGRDQETHRGLAPRTWRDRTAPVGLAARRGTGGRGVYRKSGRTRAGAARRAFRQGWSGRWDGRCPADDGPPSSLGRRQHVTRRVGLQ